MRPEAPKSIENPEMVPGGVPFSQGNINVAFLATIYRTLWILSTKSKLLRQSSKKIVLDAGGSLDIIKPNSLGDGRSDRVNENTVLRIASWNNIIVQHTQSGRDGSWMFASQWSSLGTMNDTMSLVKEPEQCMRAFCSQISSETRPFSHTNLAQHGDSPSSIGASVG